LTLLQNQFHKHLTQTHFWRDGKNGYGMVNG